LSFAKERIGPLAAIVTTVFYLLALYLFALPNTLENLFASIYSKSLIKTTHQHLLLLVGFDTYLSKVLRYTPILVGHQDTDAGPMRYPRLSCVYDATEDDVVREPHEECMLAAEEPLSIDEAITDEAWRSAMDEERASTTENKTWEMSSLPRGHKAIGLKWVFKVNRDAIGELVKYKARLVAKGYTQR
jgi:hypothetical protein